jgi:outer membrane biosynthesis protein TonB
VKVKVDKTVLASVALHVLVLGWVMLSFSTKALEMPPEDSVPVDVIDANQLAKVMAGTKTGKKENPKPLVEKVAEAKPVDDAVGKISEKPPVVTETAPKPQPKVEEKPVEKKPDPPKVVEKPKEEPPKEEPKPVEKKPDPVKPDPIAEALKKEEKKPPPKPVQAAKPPEQQKRIVERHFDQSQIAALLDKRDPTRQAATGQTMNSNAALGLSKGTAADNSATWGSMFQRQVERCWKKPYGGIESQRPEVAFNIRLKRDGTLEGNPVPEGVPATPFLKVYQESAYRAIIECQPYNLPAAMYEEWKYFAPVFKEKNV